ncbi:Thymus-specific serine protease [Armadillidium nasatum]|uniref:Thymus-specific serine protease n=1 Tax=Armadillidium nasatum TaxID=96803 RepID=A0A5N5TCW2_9CRUS|nr:Thymus-specific serine protease [Armadillidium nasatum]
MVEYENLCQKSVYAASFHFASSPRSELDHHNILQKNLVPSGFIKTRRPHVYKMGPHPSYLIFTCLLLTFKLETISSQTSFRRTTSFLPPPEVREGVTPPPELWFTQKYFINDTFYEDGGPIFLMIESWEVVATSIVSKGSELCLEEIIKAIKSVTDFPKSEKGRKRIEKMLRLRPAIDNPSSTTLYSLRKFMEIIFQTVQYNEVTRDPKQLTIGTLCKTMTNESYGNPSQRFSTVLEYLSELPRNFSIPVNPWEFQTCTELGSFVTTDSPNQPFGNIFPLCFFLHNCKNDFGVDEHLLQRAIERTNIMYGGKNPKVTRVESFKILMTKHQPFSLTELPTVPTCIHLIQATLSN